MQRLTKFASANNVDEAVPILSKSPICGGLFGASAPTATLAAKIRLMSKAILMDIVRVL